MSQANPTDIQAFSQKELAEELGISVPSVWSGLKRLEYWGYISREYAKKRSIKVC